MDERTVCSPHVKMTVMHTSLKSIKIGNNRHSRYLPTIIYTFTKHKNDNSQINIEIP